MTEFDASQTAPKVVAQPALGRHRHHLTGTESVQS
jgi:hypothetical protein